MTVIETVVAAINAKKDKIDWENLTWDERFIINEYTFIEGYVKFLQSAQADQFVMVKVLVKSEVDKKTEFLAKQCEKYQNGEVIFSDK